MQSPAPSINFRGAILIAAFFAFAHDVMFECHTILMTLHNHQFAPPPGQMHTQGKVALQAMIARDGSVRNVKVVSGPAILARAATDAVRQWKYKPYRLNGQPVAIQTQVKIEFKMQ
jgi:TonB family protein